MTTVWPSMISSTFWLLSQLESQRAEGPEASFPWQKQTPSLQGALGKQTSKKNEAVEELNSRDKQSYSQITDLLLTTVCLWARNLLSL